MSTHADKDPFDTTIVLGEGGLATALPGEGDSFAVRLRYAVGGETIRSFAERAGISATMLSGYINEGREPTRPTLITLAGAAEVSLEWLATGRGTPFPREDRQLVPHLHRALSASFGRYRQGPGATLPRAEAIRRFVKLYNREGPEARQYVERARGLFEINEEMLGSLIPAHPSPGADLPSVPMQTIQVLLAPGNQVAGMAVTPAVAEKLLKIPAHDLLLLRAEGDSMAPEIRHGDPVFVAQSDATATLRDGIYVLESSGALMIRRVRRQITGVLHVSADADDTDAWEGQEADLRTFSKVIGRVALVLRQT